MPIQEWSFLPAFFPNFCVVQANSWESGAQRILTVYLLMKK